MALIALALSAVLAGDPDTIKVTVDFQDAGMNDVIENLTRISKVPIDLDDAARKKLGDLSRHKVNLNLKDISVTGAARLLFGPHGLQVKVVDRRKLLITAP